MPAPALPAPDRGDHRVIEQRVRPDVEVAGVVGRRTAAAVERDAQAVVVADAVLGDGVALGGGAQLVQLAAQARLRGGATGGR
jgi:hypothetical protein